MNKYITIGKSDFFRQNKTYIMGILNMTPDSFSDGGSYDGIDAALTRVRQMIAQGADVIDVGGESTRPGHVQISDEEEISRVVPVIEAIKAHFDIPVSVDTYKSSVAGAAIAAGADMVNDIWGLKYDPRMASLIAQSGVACCLMHNREKADASDIMEESLTDLRKTLDIAAKAGIDPGKIVLDPGIGFGKTYEQNLMVMKHLERFHELGCPLLLGTSRKSMIGLTLNLPVDQRVEGTLATSVMAVMAGYSFIRVHDIEANYRAVKMTEAICYGRESEGTDETIWHQVCLGIGSNLGDRKRYVNRALEMLEADGDIRGLRCSGIYETKPYGGVAQGDFLNACVCLETTKTPRELLKFVNGIENTLGRERTIRWGPRTIDLDILLYDDSIIDEPDLKIPHIDMQNREFVLKPLAEIAGHVQHPRFHKTIHELYTDLFKGEH